MKYSFRYSRSYRSPVQNFKSFDYLQQWVYKRTAVLPLNWNSLRNEDTKNKKEYGNQIFLKQKKRPNVSCRIAVHDALEK